MKKVVSTAEGVAEASTPAERPVDDMPPAAAEPQAEPDTPAPAATTPSEGGRYLRDPATGELTKVED